MAPKEISMRVIKEAVVKNKSIRKSMQNAFKGLQTNHEFYNIADEIEENAIKNVNEMNKDLLQKKDEKEQKERDRYDPQ